MRPVNDKVDMHARQSRAGLLDWDEVDSPVPRQVQDGANTPVPVKAISAEDERLDWFLYNWARWMRMHPTVVMGLGYPPKSKPFVGGGYSRSFDEMVEDADIRAAEATDAAIESLPAPGPHAVHVIHLGALWRATEPLMACYEGARGMLCIGLRARGIW